MSKFEKDLSQGSVVKNLILFALPFLVSNIVQSLYNVADMLIVGNYCGKVSMSGVNIGGQITFVLTNIIAGLCTGGTILIAQHMGAKDKKSVKRDIATLLTTLLIVSIFITILMLVFKEGLLDIMQTPKESHNESLNYLTVTTSGIVFIFGYNALSAIMRGMGDSKRPFYFVLVACITNIVLDLILVAKFKMGAQGAAIATVISQALSMILCIFYLIKNKFIFDFKPKSFKINVNTLKLLVKIGLPTAVQNGITGISFIFITAIVNTIGGVDASAAVGVVGKINGFAILPAVAMSASVSAMVAQNIGANEWKRAVKTFKIGMLIAVVISWTIFAIVQTWPGEIIKCFDNSNDYEMINCGIQYMRSFCFDYLLVPILFGFNGLFIGAGHTKFSLLVASLSSLIIRIPVSYVLGIVMNIGLIGTGAGSPMATFISLFFVVWFYISGRWKKNEVSEV